MPRAGGIARSDPFRSARKSATGPVPPSDAPESGDSSREAAEAYPHRMSPELSGSGRRSGSGCLGRMCALHSAAFRKERRRLREIPPRRRLIRTGCPRNCRGAGEGPAAVVWDECAPCAARHSERSGADCGKSLRGGRLFARDVPGTCRRAGEGPAAADAGGCEKRQAPEKLMKT